MTSCFAFIEGSSTPAAIKAFALSALCNLSKFYPEIKNELKLIIEERWNHGPQLSKAGEEKFCRRWLISRFSSNYKSPAHLMKILGIYYGEVAVFILFQCLVFYSWKKIIDYLKTNEKKYLRLARAFLALQIISTLLLTWTAVSDGTFGAPVPMYIVISLIILFYPVRMIRPLRSKVFKIISSRFK